MRSGCVGTSAVRSSLCQTITSSPHAGQMIGFRFMIQWWQNVNDVGKLRLPVCSGALFPFWICFTEPMMCFAGRIVIRENTDNDHVDWERPCPIPAEFKIALQPDMWFCPQHYQVAVDAIYVAFEQADQIDGDIVSQADEFDLLIESLGKLGQ